MKDKRGEEEVRQWFQSDTGRCVIPDARSPARCKSEPLSLCMCVREFTCVFVCVCVCVYLCVFYVLGGSLLALLRNYQKTAGM